jgi:hypothetical protein
MAAALVLAGLLGFVPLLQPRAPTPARWSDAPSLPPAAAAAPNLRAPEPPVMVVMEAPTSTTPMLKSNSVTRRGGGQLISWYFNSISSTRLLSKEQEHQLANMIIAGDEYERMRDELELQLGRRPRLEEWAAEAGLEKRELRKRMRRANSARDLMVAANSARLRPCARAHARDRRLRETVLLARSPERRRGSGAAARATTACTRRLCPSC